MQSSQRSGGPRTVETARITLISKFGLDEPQANAILQMQLRRLAALEQQKITDEKNGPREGDRPAQDDPLVRGNIQGRDPDARPSAFGEKFGDARRTQISADLTNIEKEDLIEDKTVARLHHHAELHQADGPRHLPPAAPRRTGVSWA